MTEKSPAIFISHSSKDRELASSIINLIKAFFEIDDDQIRCTSITGYNLQGGSNISNTLSNDIKGSALIIGILTPNSMRSPWVFCELGAGWALTKNLIPVIAGLTYKEVQGPLGVAYCFQLDNKDNIDGIINQIRSSLPSGIKNRSISRSEQDNFIESITSKAKRYISFVPDYENDNLYSLHFSSPAFSPEERVFQDFRIRRDSGININPIHFMWADSFTGGRIECSVMNENNSDFLRVKFNNGVRDDPSGEKTKGWASNLKIKPIGDAAFRNSNIDDSLRFNRIIFYARSVKDNSDGSLEVVGISVRIVDRRLTYWSYSSAVLGGTPSQFRATRDWQKFSIDLINGGFEVFSADGNTTALVRNKFGRPIPDFSVIAGISFIVGSYTGGKEEPGIGAGLVDFRDIHLE